MLPAPPQAGLPTLDARPGALPAVTPHRLPPGTRGQAPSTPSKRAEPGPAACGGSSGSGQARAGRAAQDGGRGLRCPRQQRLLPAPTTL